MVNQGMNLVNVGIGIDIAAPIIMLICIIIGVVKGWAYRKVDKEKFIAIYKPYKYWGFGIWMVLNLIGLALIMYS